MTNSIDNVIEVQKMLQERLAANGYKDVMAFYKSSGIADFADRETVRKCFNDPEKMPTPIKVALVMKYLGYSPVMIKNALRKLGDTVYYTMMSDDAIALSPAENETLNIVSRLAEKSPEAAEAARGMIALLDKLTDTLPSSDKPAVHANLFSDHELDMFYGKVVAQNEHLGQIERDFITHVLMMLGDEGNVSALKPSHIPANQHPKNNHFHLVPASIKRHALSTAMLVRPTAVKLIAALAHDLWRIPKIKKMHGDDRSSYEITVSILESIPSFFVLPCAEDVRALLKEYEEGDQFAPLSLACGDAFRSEAVSLTRGRDLVHPVSFATNKNPGLPLIAKKTGEVVFFDRYADEFSNANMLNIGDSGAGKSVLTKHQILLDLLRGRQVVVNDIGYTHSPSVELLGGKIFNLHHDGPYCFNPMCYVSDIEIDSPVVVNTFMSLLDIKQSKEIPDTYVETVTALLRNGIKQAWKEKGNSSTVDDVVRATRSCVKKETKAFQKIPKSLFSLLDLIEESLAPYCRKGPFAAWLSPVSPKLVFHPGLNVIEYEELKAEGVFTRFAPLVFALQALSCMKDGATIVIEEAWQFFQSKFHDWWVMDGIYRHCRISGGSVIVNVQSVFDLKFSGAVGNTVQANSNTKIYSRSKDVPQAIQEGLLNFTEEAIQEIMSLEVPIHGREFYIDSPTLCGPFQHVLDPYLTGLFSSDSRTHASIAGKRNDGLSPVLALLSAIKTED